jgi:cell division protein FtsN
MVWLVLGVLLGLLIAAIVYIKRPGDVRINTGSSAATSSHTSKSARTTAGSNTKKAAASQQSSSPEFDFYTVLPKMQVNPSKTTSTTSRSATAPTPPATTTAPAANSATTPATTTQTPAPTSTPADIIDKSSSTPTTATTSATKEKYWLQIVSLKNYADADRYKAELTMSGLDVSIQSYKKSDQTYNRVVMGPYDSRQAAQQQQAQLKQKHIDSIVVKTQ